MRRTLRRRSRERSLQARSAAASARTARSRSARCIPCGARDEDELQRSTTCRSMCPRGEFFGIVGRNGSGKSTLLKCLAGIYEADSGEIRDARAAVRLHRARRRLQPRAHRARQRASSTRSCSACRAQRGARRASTAIIAFAELEEFVDLKLKNYSSGMQVRLAFAVADAGRRRRPAGRRGARRGRRRVPAEVLRAVPAAEGRRSRRSCS